MAIYNQYETVNDSDFDEAFHKSLPKVQIGSIYTGSSQAQVLTDSSTDHKKVYSAEYVHALEKRHA